MLPVIIGSISDQVFLDQGLKFLTEHNIVACVTDASVHRYPIQSGRVINKIVSAQSLVIIAGAATATGLPGAVAGQVQELKLNSLVLGVRFSKQPEPSIIEDASFNLSAMPRGVPLAYCGYNETGFLHACMLAVRIIAPE